MTNESKDLREKIHKSVGEYFKQKKEKEFVPNKSRVQYAGAFFDEKEVNSVIDSLLDGWLGLSKRGQELEEALARYVGGKTAVLTNSGSSANLLALTALKSEQSEFKVKDGDEVIVPVCSFPTTVNPIIQNGLVPVFTDIKLGTYNLDMSSIKNALSEKSKVLLVTHMFGNPNEMDEVMEFAEENNLVVIEDNCDSLGSAFKSKKTGSYGVMSTHSFYPAHHMTMGEGGAVVTNNKSFDPILRSLRDWGRACVCQECLVSVDPNFFCGMRFNQEIEGLPKGYDKKYIYSNIGYNLKPTEMQAAFGIKQLERMDGFKKARQENFSNYYEFFKKFEDYFVLPEWSNESDVSWFCFPLTIKDSAKFTRPEIISFLEEKNNIETRLFFSSNILKHPAYKGIKHRVAEDLKNSNKVLEDSFFIGIYPGITTEKAEFVKEKIREFMKNHV